MQFYNPAAFIWLWQTLGIVLFFIWGERQRRQRLAKIGDLEILQTRLMPRWRSSSVKARATLLILVYLFATFALAQPQWGAEKKKIERKGVDVIFLLDTSLSMLAEDARPSRLEKSKMEIKSFIRRMKGDRVGMVAFAGSGFLQTPLTLDYSAFFLFLDAIKTGYIPDPGTSLDRAIKIATKSFPEENLKHRAVVLFSDGEDHEGEVENALAEAKKAGVRIYVVGTGGAKGEPIPLKDESGIKMGFKKDQAGEIVITKLNQTLLEKVAAETGAVYLPSTPAEREIDFILKHMESLGKRRLQEKQIQEKEDHYQLFLLFAVLFLIGETLSSSKALSERKPANQFAVLALIFMSFSGFIQSSKQLNDKGNKLYAEKKYQSATEEYRKAQVKKPNDPTIRYNLATTLYQTDQYQESAKELEKSIEQAKDPALKARAYYNYGNAQYRLGNFEKAIEAYQQSLEINPKDVDAKYNLEFLQKEKSLFEQKDKERKKDQQQQQDKQQNQQQNQQQQNQEQQNQDNESGQDDPQQDQGSSQEQEERDKQDQQDQQSGQGQKEDAQQDEDQKSSQERDQQEPQKEDEQQDQGGQEEEERPAGQDEQQQGSGAQPLQGQMKIENALRLLDALKESEKELQDLRRPPVNNKSTPPAKDW